MSALHADYSGLERRALAHLMDYDNTYSWVFVYQGVMQFHRTLKRDHYAFLYNSAAAEKVREDFIRGCWLMGDAL